MRELLVFVVGVVSVVGLRLVMSGGGPGDGPAPSVESVSSAPAAVAPQLRARRPANAWGDQGCEDGEVEALRARADAAEARLDALRDLRRSIEGPTSGLRPSDDAAAEAWLPDVEAEVLARWQRTILPDAELLALDCSEHPCIATYTGPRLQGILGTVTMQDTQPSAVGGLQAVGYRQVPLADGEQAALLVSLWEEAPGEEAQARVQRREDLLLQDLIRGSEP